jgi:hypothetical protein
LAAYTKSMLQAPGFYGLLRAISAGKPHSKAARSGCEPRQALLRCFGGVDASRL